MTQTTVLQTLDQLVEEKTDGIFGLMAAFMNARSTIGDKYVEDFCKKVPEKGEALWLCFRAFQKGKPDFNFNHFIASVIMPNPLSGDSKET